MRHENYQAEFLSYLTSERSLSKNTAVTYGHHLNAYFRFLEKEESITPKVTSDLVTEYIGGLGRRGLTSSTRFCATIAIRSFHRFLLEKGYAKSDPSAGLSLPKLKSPIVEPLSVAEVEQFLDAPSPHSLAGLRDRAILELLYCGLRISEALGLDMVHIHLADGYAKVLGKGSRERLVPIGSKAVQILRLYLQRRNQTGYAEGAIFRSRSGARLGKNGFWRRFKRYAVRAGINRRVYPHLLRHSYAVHLLQGKADLRSLQLLLGHSSLTSTQRYLNLNHQALRETCEKAHPRF
jgi:integrase/recombinase XerD